MKVLDLCVAFTSVCNIHRKVSLPCLCLANELISVKVKFTAFGNLHCSSLIVKMSGCVMSSSGHLCISLVTGFIYVGSHLSTLESVSRGVVVNSYVEVMECEQ